MHSNLLRSALFLVAVGLLAGTASAQASFTLVPNGFRAVDITPDGETVVGSWDPGTGFQTFIWNWKVDPMPTGIPGGWPVAISDDGTTVFGNIDDPDPPAGAGTGDQVGAIWTQATGWQSIGFLSGALSCPSRSSAYDLTADGLMGVGHSWQGCSARAFTYTDADGMVELEHLGASSNTARAVSADGSAVVGYAQYATQSPAYWFFNGTDYTGVVIDSSRGGELKGANADGSVLYGNMEFPGESWFQAITYEVATGTITNLGTANVGWGAQAIASNGAFLPEGLKIIGTDINGLGRDGWLWTQADGIVRLNDLLAAAGVAGVPALGPPLAITPDGGTIVGYTDFVGAWIIELPTSADSNIYSGCGANPAGSMSVLSGSPTLGTTMTFGLDNPLGSMSPGALSRLTFSTGAIANPCGLNLPGYGMAFNGAVGELLITLPKLITISGANWDGVNPAPVPAAIPSNVPLLGFTLYAQGALVDVSGGVHIGLTEAIRITLGS